MLIGLPTPKRDLDRKLMRFVLDDPGELESVISKAWYPTLFRDDTREWLFHASSLPFVLTHPRFRAYASEAARRFALAYLTEANRTFGDPATSGRLHPLRTDFDWHSCFTNELKPRPYQFAGMERLYYRAKHFARGNLLADDTGLGKTIQLIGVMTRYFIEGKINAERPCAVVTTATTKGQWGDEIIRFSKPRPIVNVANGTRDERRKALIAPGHIYVLSWEMLRLPQYTDLINSLAKEVSTIVLDETAAIQNPESSTAEAARKFCQHADTVFGANATPIENGLGDLFTQLELIDSRCIGDLPGFRARYAPVDTYGRERTYHNLGEFKRRSAMLYFRRTKTDCGEQFAEVTPETRTVVFEKAQQDAYAVAAGEFLDSSDTGAVGFTQLAKAVRAACFADINLDNSPSAKLDDLIHLLDTELRHERLVIFTKFRTIAVAMQRRMERFQPYMIHGTVPTSERDQTRREFNDTTNPRRVLIGTEAMSRGLNLQGAGVVVNMDLPWNPAKLRQRVGRCARFGQLRSAVLVINYRGGFPNPRIKTVDDYFLSIILRKKSIFDRIYGDDGIDTIGDTSKRKGDGIDLSTIRRFLTRLPTPKPAR